MIGGFGLTSIGDPEILDAVKFIFISRGDAVGLTKLIPNGEVLDSDLNELFLNAVANRDIDNVAACFEK
ncbi:MAG: hypothetical protein HON90_15610 [Halobacteriovoraceae bacterium]|jgi:hypothetical protein|nr:hypothetical protein [Halobacteriovoraceae bacterium]MBT6120437.1 hypothetical protein [bacterium]